MKRYPAVEIEANFGDLELGTIFYGVPDLDTVFMKMRLIRQENHLLIDAVDLNTGDYVFFFDYDKVSVPLLCAFEQDQDSVIKKKVEN